jgi:glycosyltransferase involved in cell wall biosynthesis
VGPRTAIVLQDHSGALPRRLPWPAGPIARQRWRRAFREVTACTFTARELAARWFRAGLPRALPTVEILEASTALAPMDQTLARERTGIRGAPLILAVGRLDANKDPLTVIDVLDRALPALPEARAVLISTGGPHEASVRARLVRSPMLSTRVSVHDRVPYARMHEYYSAADVFVSGSHHEGSGYALIEAMACGVTPCVTEIPAFRAIAGSCGPRWPPGDATAGAAALVQTVQRLDTTSRARVRTHFAASLSWDVVGARTVTAYRAFAEDVR